MSQILIISDSHYLRKNELHQFFKQFPHCSTIIHCGDIYPGYQPDEFDNFYICKGNNDYVNLPRILSFTIDHVRFTITHVHIKNYAYQPDSLLELLNDYPADVICFGHTHIPYFQKTKDCIIINPGSLALGRSYPRQNTYALFDTETKDIHFYDMKTKDEIILENRQL